MNKAKLKQLNTVRDIRVPFGPTSAILNRLEALQASGPRPGEGRVLAFVGASRSGKSTILRAHAKKSDSPQLRSCRVPSLTLPNKCNERTFAAEVLKAMGDAAAFANTRVQSLSRIPLVAESMGVEMIIIDEAQHLVNRRNRAVNYEAADAIKVLSDLVGIPIVLAGTEDLDILIRANPQLEGRLVGRISISPFSVESEESFKELRAFLRLYDLQLPFEMTSGLHDVGIASAVHAASAGLIGRITQLLSLSAHHAIAEGRPYVDLYHLAQAWEELAASASDGEGLSNPFDRVREPNRETKSNPAA